jgi:predicted RNase H-like HicB family nuclease
LTNCAVPTSVRPVKARYTVVLDREVDGRAMASVPGLPGCHAYGRTPSEAVRRVKSAVRFYLKQVMKQGS